MLNGKHILIENCPGMGDLIMATPALRRLKELYPRCILSVVSYSHNLPIIERLPYIDHVYGIAKGKFLGHFRPALHFPGQDYAVFTSWQPQLARMAKLLRVPHRAGVCKEKYRGTGLFQKELPMHDFRDRKYRADFITEQISLALGIDLSNDGICEVAKPVERDMAQATSLLAAHGLKGGKYVAIAPYAMTERSLPEKLLCSAIRYVTEEKGLPAVIIHSKPTDMSGILKEMPHTVNLCGLTSLRQMAAILAMAQFAVCVDSGPMHVSAALGTPTLGIFSSGNHRAWLPRKSCVLLTLDKDCSPCKRETAEKCEEKECIQGITMEMMQPALEKMLHLANENKGEIRCKT